MRGVSEQAVGTVTTPAVRESNPLPPRVRRATVLALIWVGGVALSTAAFYFVWHCERMRVEQEFEWRARSQAEALRGSLLDHDEVLFTMRNLYDSSENVTADEFRRTAADLRARHPGIHLLQWMPHVRHADRADFEAAAQREFQRPYFIHHHEALDAPTEPAGESADYLPMLYAEPVEGNRVALGCDAFQGPHQRAITRTLETGTMAATRRVALREPTETEFGWAVFMPVYEGGVLPPTAEERRAKLRGMLQAEYRLSTLITTNFQDAPEGALDLLLVDETPGGTEPFLIGSTPDGWKTAPPPSAAMFKTGLHRAIPLSEAGRDWVLLCRPSAAWLARQQSPYPYEFFLAGLLLTALCASSVRAAQKRTRSIEKLVSERTSELRSTQRALEADLRERQRMSEERAEDEARLRLALSAADLGTWEWIVPTDEVTWSDGTERIFGMAPGAFDGRYQTYLDAVHPEDRARLDALNRRAWDHGTEIFAEHRIVWPDGSTHWITARGHALRDAAGKPIRMMGAVMDVTAQHAAAEERAEFNRRLQETQKLESLGVLAGGIAHDFNNLLTGILGNASLARMDLPPASPVQTYLEQIELVSQRAAELCMQMLAYSGKGRFVVQRLDLSQLVDDMAQLLSLSVSKNATLKFDCARDLPPILADATQLRQIVMNLVINASDALEERSGVIHLRTGLRPADRTDFDGAHLSPDLPAGDYIFLEVSDDGCGMSEEVRAKIFDPFFTTKFTGRGLGLAAVLGIVRGHRAALKVVSEPGKGSTFTLLLPRAEGSAQEFASPAADEKIWRGTGSVLVVDDEETVRRVAGRMLEVMGFAVVLATTGPEALEKFQEPGKTFEAVLLDLTMPGMDGSEVFAGLRRIDPHVCVLLMSGFNEQDAISRFAGQGLAGFMQKPFKPETLRTKLREILES